MRVCVHACLCVCICMQICANLCNQVSICVQIIMIYYAKMFTLIMTPSKGVYQFYHFTIIMYISVHTVIYSPA